MSHSDEFYLQWNDFEENIRESFTELRKDQNYFDVTIATSDNHQIRAHKIILSAGSQYFSSILKHINNSSPFIYLKGITKKELDNLVDFLYNGQACIAEEELNNFLNIAQEFKVKGLLNDLNARNQTPEIILEEQNRY